MRTDHKEVNMFRHALRVAVLTAAVAATLALAGNALAAPTTPALTSPTGPWVFDGPLTVSWTPSTFDAGAFPTWYHVTVIDLTPGQLWVSQDADVLTPGTSTTINVYAPDRYSVCVRAMEVLNGMQQTSPSSCQVFTASQRPILKKFIYEKIKFPPDPPWCLSCPIWKLTLEGDPDPRVLRMIEESRGFDYLPALGLSVDPLGHAEVIYGR